MTARIAWNGFHFSVIKPQVDSKICWNSILMY